MATCAKLARRSGSLFFKTSSPGSLATKRPFSTIICNARVNKPGGASCLRWKRTIIQSAQPSITGQEPPNAAAYISSGVLSGQKSLVDVKKVLVIGSGGLSIGQAGEFDYSGKIRFFVCVARKKSLALLSKL